MKSKIEGNLQVKNDVEDVCVEGAKKECDSLTNDQRKDDENCKEENNKFKADHDLLWQFLGHCTGSLCRDECYKALCKAEAEESSGLSNIEKNVILILDSFFEKRILL